MTATQPTRRRQPNPGRRPGRSKRRRESRRPLAVVLSGTVVVTVIVLLIVGAFESPNGLPLKSYRTLYVRIANPGNLLPHSEVREAGVLVGQVLSISASGNQALVHLQLGSGTRLPADTQVLIRGQGVLGQRYVDLVPGRSHRYLANGATIAVPATALTYGVPDALDTFNQQTRGALRTMLDNLGIGFLGRGTDLNTAIGVGPETAADFTTVADAILARPGAAARLVPSLDQAVQALDGARRQITASFRPGVAALAPFVENRKQFGATLQQAPSTLATARPALQHGTGLLAAVAAVADAAQRTLPAAPAGLRAATTLLATSHVPLARTHRLLQDAIPAVPAVLETTSALSPVVTPLRNLATDLDPLVSQVGVHGCDLYNMASNWRSALGYGVANGSGAQLPSGGIGPLNYFRVTLIAGTSSLQGLAQPQATLGTRDVYAKACAYAPGAKYLDPTDPAESGTG